MSSPKYQKLQQAILRDIRHGKYKPHERLPVRQALVEHYQVTRTTLDRALGELVRDGLLITSKRGGTVVAAQESPLKIAIVLSRLSAEAWQDNQLMDDTGLAPMLTNLIASGNGVQVNFLLNEQVLDDFSLTQSCDTSVWFQPSEEALERLKPYRDDVIVLNRCLDDFSTVSTDHRQATKELTLSLLDHFDKPCQVYFLNYGDSYVFNAREAGFLDACEQRHSFYRILNLNHDSQVISDALLNLKPKKDMPICLVSSIRFIGGVIPRMMLAHGLTWGKNFLCGDWDNRNNLDESGIQIPSIIQNYNQMGQFLPGMVSRIRSGQGQENVVVPHKILGSVSVV